MGMQEKNCIFCPTPGFLKESCPLLVHNLFTPWFFFVLVLVDQFTGTNGYFNHRPHPFRALPKQRPVWTSFSSFGLTCALSYSTRLFCSRIQTKFLDYWNRFSQLCRTGSFSTPLFLHTSPFVVKVRFHNGFENTRFTTESNGFVRPAAQRDASPYRRGAGEGSANRPGELPLHLTLPLNPGSAGRFALPPQGGLYPAEPQGR